MYRRLSELLKTAQGPVIVGSGVDAHNLEKYARAHALIVGTHFKVDGKWENPVDAVAVNDFMKHLSRLTSWVEIVPNNNYPRKIIRWYLLQIQFLNITDTVIRVT